MIWRQIGRFGSQSPRVWWWPQSLGFSATTDSAALLNGSQAIGADLADLEKLESVVIATEQALAGHVDILVNSAAVFEYDTLKSVSASSLGRHLEVNVTAAVLLTRFATRHTSRNEPGLILNILDYKIHNPFPDFLSYTLTKYAMHGFTQVAACGFGPSLAGLRLCAGIHARRT